MHAWRADAVADGFAKDVGLHIRTLRTQLDADTQEGVDLTNVVGAIEWFNDDNPNPDRVSFNRQLTNGTVGVDVILEGALPQQIDKVLLEFGFPMGPFAMGDLAGLDVGWRIRQARGTKDTVADTLCERGRFGQKTGKGYYLYSDGRTPTPDPEVEKLILDTAKAEGITRRAISDDEILKRSIYPMINEGVKILEEGKAIRASDIDVVWVNGYGWPVYRGGPMFYGDFIGGPAKVLAKMKEFQTMLGDDFKPAALLEKLAAEGKRISDLKG